MRTLGGRCSVFGFPADCQNRSNVLYEWRRLTANPPVQTALKYSDSLHNLQRLVRVCLLSVSDRLYLTRWTGKFLPLVTMVKSDHSPLWRSLARLSYVGHPRRQNYLLRPFRFHHGHRVRRAINMSGLDHIEVRLNGLVPAGHRIVSVKSRLTKWNEELTKSHTKRRNYSLHPSQYPQWYAGSHVRCPRLQNRGQLDNARTARRFSCV